MSEYLSDSNKDKIEQANKSGSVQFKDKRQSSIQFEKYNNASTVQREKNSTGLPDNLKSGMENLTDVNLDNVKVHYNSSKPAAVQAHAYAQGTDIHLASGQEQHLPHELGHVVQQAQGKVKPTTSVGGMPVNDSPQLESEATKLGEMAMQRKALEKSEYNTTANGQGITQCIAVVQREDDPVEEAVLVPEEEDSVKEDINIAMRKIKAKITQWAQGSDQVVNKLKGTGRDAWVYRGLWRRNETLKQHLDAWDDSWSYELTCGLLLDLGNALRRLCPDKKEIMNKTMKDSRKGDHEIDKDSRWATDFVPENTEMQSGVSATTGNLLRTLRQLDVTSNDEIEAIMIGVVKYWKDGSIIKRMLGEYHTAAEVWSAYTFHLETYVQNQD